MFLLIVNFIAEIMRRRKTKLCIEELQKENDLLSENYAWCNEEMIRMGKRIRKLSTPHPTCETCAHYSEYYNRTAGVCANLDHVVVIRDFYCKDHEEKKDDN